MINKILLIFGIVILSLNSVIAITITDITPVILEYDKSASTISGGNVTLPTGKPYKLMKFNSHGEIGESDIYEKTDVLGYGVYIPTNENLIFGNNPTYARFKHSSVDNVLNYDGAVLKYLSAFSVYSYYLRDSGTNQMSITNTGEYPLDAITQDMTLSANNNISLRASVGSTNKAVLGRLGSNWNSLYLTDDIKFYPSKTSSTKVYEIKRDTSNNMIFTGTNKTQIRTITHLGNISDYTEIQKDGSLIMYGNATTWNIVQQDINANNFHDDVPRYIEEYGGYEFNSERELYINFIVPHDSKNNSLVQIQTHYIHTGDCERYEFEYTITHRPKCRSSTSSERVNGASYCGTPQEGYHVIDSADSSIIVKMEDIVQVILTRSDECTDYSPIILAMDMLYEQNSIGSRNIMSK